MPEGEAPAEGTLERAAAMLARWRDPGGTVRVVAIDGHGASGKSTIAGRLSALTGAALVHTDDFFSPAPALPPGGGGRDLGSYYDVPRLRWEALEPLRAGREASYRPYDWDAGTLAEECTHVAPAALVILEGVYSASPALSDLVDKAVYVRTPEPERLRRLRRLIAPEDWDEDWLRAEAGYFAVTRPMASFDLVVRGGRRGAGD